MRDDTENVLCTEVLKIVEADFEDVCENYEERSEYPDYQLHD
jgi:hypothetical protein